VKILLASAEVAPFAKVGGLADVAGSLPRALADLELDVRVIMPKYRTAAQHAQDLRCILETVPVSMPTYESGCAVHMTTLPNSSVPIYMVEHNDYFDRDGIYGPPGGAYADNLERLTFFCRATLATIGALDWQPDVIHLNDWHTALIAAYCKLRALPHATVFTAHNLGVSYQGSFPQSSLSALGLDLGDIRVQKAVRDGRVNLAAIGMMYADMINTVSPTYAVELREPIASGELAGIITDRGDDVWGILNGIDYHVWSPASDGSIAAHFHDGDRRGKAVCKADLQDEFGLSQNADVPLLGMVTRLDAQKGLDLVAELLDELSKVQLVLLGTGDPHLEAIFAAAADSHPHLAVRLEYSDVLARKVYAGADMFLMPSRYEPCGLGQMIALAYGTVPIVRRTGGLADSIKSRGPRPNGFDFTDYSAQALQDALSRALQAYADKPRWEKLMTNAFASDFSWTASARRYRSLYKASVERRQSTALNA
jgi:starch synthase